MSILHPTLKKYFYVVCAGSGTYELCHLQVRPRSHAEQFELMRVGGC